jgi:3-oxoacyl-[acyl-carrier protein] reductase
MDIKGNLFVITGGARGLGRAMAERIAAEGGRLALIDIEAAQLQATVAELSAQGAVVNGYTTDITDEQQLTATFGQIVTDAGAINGLINNAGILRDGFLVKAREGKVTGFMSLEQWQSVIDVNLTGVFLCGREAAMRMIDSGTRGLILNISSVVNSGNAGQSNYAAAKAGVASLTVTWARELNRQGIRVAGISPGVFETDMVASMKAEAHDRITAQIPLGRTGDVAELADAAAWIIGNDYFHGRMLQLDGGIVV